MELDAIIAAIGVLLCTALALGHLAYRRSAELALVQRRYGTLLHAHDNVCAEHRCLKEFIAVRGYRLVHEADGLARIEKEGAYRAEANIIYLPKRKWQT